MITSLPLDVLRHVMLRFTNAQTVTLCYRLNKQFLQIFRDYVVKRVNDPTCDIYKLCKFDPEHVVKLLTLHQKRIKSLRICSTPHPYEDRRNTFGTLQAVSTLQHLNLIKLTLFDCSSHYLTLFPNSTNLRALSLHFNARRQQVYETQMHFLATTFRKLEFLELRFSSVQSWTTPPLVLPILMKITSIQELWLSSSPQIEGRPLANMLPSIVANTHLTAFYLALHGRALEPNALSQLVQMTQLTALTFTRYLANDASLEKIATGLKLKQLHLTIEGVQHRGFSDCVNKCTSLVALHLGSRNIPSPIFTELQKLKRVTWLSVASTQEYSNEEIERVRRMPMLRSLVLRVTDQKGVCLKMNTFGQLPSTRP